MEDSFKNAWHHVRGITSEEMRQAAIDAERMYGDIINLPHPVSKKHPPLTMEQKAAQYSPFAALTGYEDAVMESGRLTERRIELDEDRRQELDQKLRQILGRIAECPSAGFTYFVPDRFKDGGEYVTVCGRIRKIDSLKKRILLQDGTEIPICDITEISLQEDI